MKTSLASRLEELIEHSSDKQFNKIYTDLKDYEKRHCLEFRIMKKISLMDDLVNIIEEQKEMRQNIKNEAKEISDKCLEFLSENPQPEVVKPEESWMTWWRKPSPVPSSIFKQTLLSVVFVHISLILFMVVYNTTKPSPEPLRQAYPQIHQEPVYQMPTYDTTKDNKKGPLSDALSKR